MRSSFFGLHVASSAINASRAQLNTIGHNIANVATDGFSRQVAVQRATQPLRVFGPRGMIGTGSQITTITRMRNPFLDQKFWHQNSVHGQFWQKNSILQMTGGIIRNGDNTGLNAEFNDIMTHIQNLKTDAPNMTMRANLTSSFESLATYMNHVYRQLTQQMIDANQEMGAIVGVINSLGRQIQSLNRSIVQMEMDGSNANDLRDQRGRLIDELSGFVNIDVREIETNPEFAAGRVTDPAKSRRETHITIDGAPFISHFNLNQLEVRQRRMSDNTLVARNFEEPPGMYDIYWENGMIFDKFSRSLSGQLKGIIDMLYGNGGNQGIALRGATLDDPHRPSLVPSTGTPPGSAGAGITPVLTLHFDSSRSRMDFPQPGVLQVVSPAGGTNEFTFSNVRLFRDLDANGEWDGIYRAEFDLHGYPDQHVSGESAFNAMNSDITIGRTTNYRGLPYFMNRLNVLARTWAMAMNEGRYLDGGAIPGMIGHLDAWDLNIPPQRGHLLFTYRQPFGENAGQPQSLTLDANGFPIRDSIRDIGVFNIHNLTAGNIMLNDTIARDPRRLAISGDPNTTGESANHAIMSWTYITADRGLFREGRLGDFIAALTGSLGVVWRQAENFALSYDELLVVIENQRLSFSGVDMNEETALMIQHQLIFQAAARMMSTIDNIYDTLINQIGNR